jgi:hypothetical protein
MCPVQTVTHVSGRSSNNGTDEMLEWDLRKRRQIVPIRAIYALLGSWMAAYLTV